MNFSSERMRRIDTIRRALEDPRSGTPLSIACQFRIWELNEPENSCTQRLRDWCQEHSIPRKRDINFTDRNGDHHFIATSELAYRVSLARGHSLRLMRDALIGQKLPREVMAVMNDMGLARRIEEIVDDLYSASRSWV